MRRSPVVAGRAGALDRDDARGEEAARHVDGLGGRTSPGLPGRPSAPGSRRSDLTSIAVATEQLTASVRGDRAAGGVSSAGGTHSPAIGPR